MKINPFRPNSPVPPGMFAGRGDLILTLQNALFQTRENNSANFMLTGERGIGKSSLLNYLKFIAEGDIDVNGNKFNFLVVEVDIEPTTTKYSLVKKIELALERKLGSSEKVKTFLKDTWGFISRFEAAGVKLNVSSDEDNAEILLDEFAYSLSETAKRITKEDKDFLSSTYDGILLLIDEADNCSPLLDLGTFLKLFMERLQKNDCHNVMVGVAGLPNLHSILVESHPSSLRLFNQLIVDRLESEEVESVIDRCLKLAEEKNGVKTTIDEDAKRSLINASEGFPHFIQQYGYSVFQADVDDNISMNDVNEGLLGKNGAIEIIGERYYRNDFYSKIKSKPSREVLRIMSEKLNEWVKRSYIKGKFKGKDSTMDTAIKILCDKKIIVAKEGVRGVYRLQQKAFAVWIKYYTGEVDGVQSELDISD